jgi:sterol desaturase/sphingolipid hydroxylase (fatty acid hydroxylase superfamily)
LTCPNPLTIVGVYVPATIALLYYYLQYLSGSISVMVALVAGGLFFWSFAEYIMHRYLYHFITDSPIVKKLHYVMHGHHHEYPRDKGRLILPLIPSIFLALFFFGLFWLAMGPYAFAFYPGFVFGYLAYAHIHYAIHSMSPPKYVGYVWKHHYIHHFQEQDRAFGVSSPLWDYIFGTMPRRYYKKRSSE